MHDGIENTQLGFSSYVYKTTLFLFLIWDMFGTWENDKVPTQLNSKLGVVASLYVLYFITIPYTRAFGNTCSSHKWS